MATAVARINTKLKDAGLTQRLIRNRSKGYYYVTDVAVSSMLTVYSLDSSERDYILARNHVNEVLQAEGLPFRL